MGNNDYVDYLINHLEKSIDYTEYLADTLDKSIDNTLNPIDQKLVDRKWKLKRLKRIIRNELL
jgi:hypothetical protein